MSAKVDFIDFAYALSSTLSDATIIPKITVGCNGNIYVGNYGDWSGVGSGLYNASASELSTVTASQKLYIVDGTPNTVGTLIQVSMIDESSYQRLSTGGTGEPPDEARIVSLYRNRLVLTRTNSDPHDWFMSMVDNYTNFDYADQTVIGAVAGNNSDAGKIGDVITCWATVTDDQAVIGCSDSVWMMRGDPKSGGRIDRISKGNGIVGQWAWCTDPMGRMYYMTRTDLMAIAPGGGQPVSISNGRLQRFFENIDYSLYTIRMAWDTIRQGVWMFLTKAAAAANTSLFWDARLDAFSTHSFPAAHGPTAVRSLQGETYADRQLLFGGFDGIVRTFANGWTTDDGTAISSRMLCTPTAMSEFGRKGILNETELVLGAVNAPHVDLTWYTGDNAQDAISMANPAYTASIYTTGRYLNRERARGQVAALKLSNTRKATTWALDAGTVLVSPAGRSK